MGGRFMIVFVGALAALAVSGLVLPYTAPKKTS